ncbi:winged helix-turn-helix transcriptional regulator [Ornithinibacillus sp. L9]|uniref:Winged helix-turn-helix transcriptional regulator n=1 Tax=Ornithinibacillus caprae TaxID=2678566 RepID=A0A6N8FHE1_9BACI|nr:PfkB family carbohydrate kinase [Ornithinibacillus caprae]MUK88641.1 winged helix-turn-helix transcriptional regulator [Ornithinibacillus caprae]
MKKRISLLSEKEQTVLKLIKKDPFISQQQLASELELSRPSIANIISGLVKKGYIKGKAYILNEVQPVVCIGGANLDRKFYIDGETTLGTSNPVHSSQNAGGVARNIGENLGRLGEEVILLTASGMDAEWSIIEKASSSFMNLEYVTHFTGESTGSYTAVLDNSGELFIALADMDIYDLIKPELIEQHIPLLSQSKCLMVDLNCPKDTLEYLCEFARGKEIPLIFVAVSSPKMDRLPENLAGLTWLITNRDETSSYFSMNITNSKDLEQAVDKWLEKGIKNVVITNGKHGVSIGNKNEGIFHIPSIEVSKVEDVTGAGDAFSSAAIHAWLNGKSLTEIAKAGVINAAKTLQSAYTVRQDLHAEQLYKDMEELS